MTTYVLDAYHAWHAYNKAYDAGKRLPEIEDIVLADSWVSCRYALNVVKGRWIEAEDFIMTNPDDSCFYAINIIKGKLPEKMHNMMILHGIKNPNDIWVKHYFNFIK